MTCENNCGFEDLSEEERSLLWEDANLGLILGNYLDALDTALEMDNTKDLKELVMEMLNEVDEMYEESEETVH